MEKFFSVVGESHYVEAFKKLGRKNPKYDLSDDEIVACGLRTIYEYDFENLNPELVFEPGNPYDKNAIAVLVNGLKIGHIAKNETTEVRKIMKSDYDLDVSISGGNRKRVIRGKVTTEIRDFSAELTIYDNEDDMGYEEEEAPAPKKSVQSKPKKKRKGLIIVIGAIFALSAIGLLADGEFGSGIVGLIVSAAIIFFGLKK